MTDMLRKLFNLIARRAACFEACDCGAELGKHCKLDLSVECPDKDCRFSYDEKNKQRQTLFRLLEKQIPWSTKTFGPGARVGSITKHIEKELAEIRANPTDLVEWVDVILLALDGAWRAGYTPEDIVNALFTKQERNFNRQWPAPTDEDTPSEHLRRVQR